MRPVLPCLTLALCLASEALAQRIADSSATLAEQYLLAAANQDRAAVGLTPLRRDPMLAQAAATHARRMAEHSGISHQFAGEPKLTERGANAGVAFSAISENVGEAPNAVQIHTMWMHSKEHRTNLLDPAIDSAGISVIARGGEFYAVEDFARTVKSASLEEQEAAIAALVSQQGSLSLDQTPGTTQAARQTCAMASGYAGARKPWFVMRFTSDSLAAIPDQLRSRLSSGRFHLAAVGACAASEKGPFTAYNLAVLLYP